MLLGTNGFAYTARHPLEHLTEYERKFLDLLDTDYQFFLLYQVHWLRCRYWKRLGSDLSGPNFDGYKRCNVYEAAHNLELLFNGERREVVPGRRPLPISAGMIALRDSTLSFLPGKSPLLFGRGIEPKTLAQLCEKYDWKEANAYKYLVYCTRSAQ